MCNAAARLAGISDMTAHFVSSQPVQCSWFTAALYTLALSGLPTSDLSLLLYNGIVENAPAMHSWSAKCLLKDFFSCL